MVRSWEKHDRPGFALTSMPIDNGLHACMVAHARTERYGASCFAGHGLRQQSSQARGSFHCNQPCIAPPMHLNRGPSTWQSARACALQALGGCASTATALATSAARAVAVLKFSSWHQGSASRGSRSPLSTPPADEAALLTYGSGQGGRRESPCRVQMWWAGREYSGDWARAAWARGGRRGGAQGHVCRALAWCRIACTSHHRLITTLTTILQPCFAKQSVAQARAYCQGVGDRWRSPVPRGRLFRLHAGCCMACACQCQPAYHQSSEVLQKLMIDAQQ